ncbi:MAG: putative class beta-lactamase, partial [Sedimentibacter sp.]|nr:putative class beta-lactamase [Sedimentibacter sp.]
MKIKFLLILVLLLTLIGCNNSTMTQKFIDDKNIDATIVVSSLNTGKEFIINKERSEQRFLPASTFKIPNTLIALQEGIVKDENEIIKWDGIDKGLVEWNKDQNLKSALPLSCVWFYQELAKEIGIENYSEYLNKLNYGNKLVGSRADNFWLEGDIRISANEQIDFLKKVYSEEYDFNKNYYKILKELLIEEKN